MDANTLAELMGNQPGVDYAGLLPHFMNAATAAQCTTIPRMAMFGAQLGHESVGLKYMQEIASGAAYEGRTDLGNTRPGDGVRFKGRGPIQLTGRNNYRAFTAWATINGHTDLDFEAEPHLLEQPKWGFLATAFYWSTARPDHAKDGKSALNRYSDERNVLNASRIINGWVTTPNGLQDRQNRYNKALSLGVRLLPNNVTVTEKRLDYPRDQVTQDTYYNCGPASAQTIIRAATGKLLSEVDLGAELGTHKGGTDYIGQFPKVLNKHLPAGKYTYTNVPGYLDDEGKQAMFAHFRDGVDAGFGSVANIVAPPSNYPKASYTSAESPAYSGGTVYHYVAVMGYAIDSAGQKHLWIADSGFRPFGYWITLDQLAGLIVPKGYAHPTTTPQASTQGELTVSEADRIIKELKDYVDVRIVDAIGSDVKDIRQQLTGGRDRGEYPGWPQLGQNAKGQNLTTIDAIAAVRHDLSAILAALQEKK